MARVKFVMETPVLVEKRIPTHMVVIKIYAPGEPPEFEMVGQFSGRIVKIIINMIPKAYRMWQRAQMKVASSKVEITMSTASKSEEETSK